MLNISAPPTARRGRAISAPTTPTQTRAIEATPSFTSSTINPFVASASNKIIGGQYATPLRSAAVLIPREPNLSDLTSYYPRADPFSDAIADPHGGFRHWSNGKLATGSPWNTPQRDRRGSGQSGVSPSVSARLTLDIKQAGLHYLLPRDRHRRDPKILPHTQCRPWPPDRFTQHCFLRISQA